MIIQELMNLKGRRALITGATGGLGSVMAETLAELGADLILVDRPGADFALIVKEIKERWGVKIWDYQCDLEQHQQRLELIESIQKDHAFKAYFKHYDRSVCVPKKSYFNQRRDLFKTENGSTSFNHKTFNL